jgi:hypothetical protein
LLQDFYRYRGEAQLSFTWLRDFTPNASQFFDGDQPYGRADDFVEAMLLAPPAVRDLGQPPRQSCHWLD